MHTEPHAKAGQVVHLTADQPILHNLLGDVAGEEVQVEDWWDHLTGGSWTNATGNPAALVYAIRGAFVELPIDDAVVYVKVDGLGMLVHESELAS